MSELQDNEEAMELEAIVPRAGATDPSLRVRIAKRRDRLIDAAASQIIKLGKASPQLRSAGLWLYGTATLLAPRGREVPKLGEVGETVYRGGQPSMRAFTTLRELGVDTVINLRPESDHERKLVERLGMKYLYLPLPPLDAPTNAAALEFIDAATDPANGTVFFHCYHGVDRTGTMAGCLRIARDGWSVDQAVQEMRAYKVHEVGQRAKLDYLPTFYAYWHALPYAEQCRVLHRPLPVEIVPEPPAGWWEKLRHGVRDRFEGLKARFRKKG